MHELLSDGTDSVEALDVELIAAVGETGFREGGQLHGTAADVVGGSLHRHQHRVEAGGAATAHARIALV